METPDVPGPKPRPGLVIATATTKTYKPRVLVIYGTSKTRMHERTLDFFVTNFREMHIAGLPQATRFDLDRPMPWLPWASEFFMPRNSNYPTPVMGELSDSAIEILEELHRVRTKMGMITHPRPFPDEDA